MRLMGEQFVTGRTIEEAINASREREARGFTFSYDMLGEAATTAEDAARYLAEYERAMHAIGQRLAQARHLRGARASRSSSRRCIRASADQARAGRWASSCRASNIWPRSPSPTTSASTSTPRRWTGSTCRSTSSRRSALDPDLAGWNGLGFVIQAYGKRCVFVVDWLVDLARRSRPAAHGAPGQGRLLGFGDQARPGRRARRLSRVHAQGPHRRLLSRRAPANCSPRPTRSIRNSPPTTRRRWPRS